MIPPLTEQWAATYLEVLAGVLVFALGVAALIIQLALPAFLLTLATRRGLWRRYTLSVTAIVGVVLVYVWALHPISDAPLTGLPALLGHALLSGALIAIVWMTVGYVRQVDSTRLVQSLVDECDVDLHRDSSFDDTLDSLIDIGGHAKAGFEKDRVISAMRQLADLVLDKYELTYDGTTLKPLLFGLETVLGHVSMHGSRENFREAAGVIKHIMDRLPEAYRDSSDMADLLSVTTALTIVVMEQFPMDGRLPATYMDILDAAPDETSDLEMFRVGITALNTSQRSHYAYEFSVRALLALLPAEGTLTGTEGNGAELLGLMAHLWFHNEGTRQLIENLLAVLEGRLTASAIDSAIGFHFSTTNFDTVDLLKRARPNWEHIAERTAL
ncbi:MAG: hypothetical protein ACFB51_02920 [Anaerolineae bacterium]